MKGRIFRWQVMVMNIKQNELCQEKYWIGNTQKYDE